MSKADADWIDEWTRTPSAMRRDRRDARRRYGWRWALWWFWHGTLRRPVWGGKRKWWEFWKW